MSGYVPPKQIKILALRNGNICAFPGCTQVLSLDSVEGEAMVIGVVAHISGEKPKSARYDAKMTDGERGAYDNLIYLCPTHHTQIDAPENQSEFSVARLKEMKREHEAKVEMAQRRAMIEVGSAELEVIANAMMATAEPDIGLADLQITDPTAKMAKNQLTEAIVGLLRMALAAAPRVRYFIDGYTKVDPEFADRLKAGFVKRYQEMKAVGLEGDELFLSLYQSCGPTIPQKPEDLKLQSAALALLGYLFEMCEVFEG